MALILENKQFNETFSVENGYARIVNIQYNSRNSQPVYDMYIYASKEDRLIEKQREAILIKWANNPEITSLIKGEQKYFEMFSSRNVILGTAEVPTNMIDKEDLVSFMYLTVPNIISEEEFITASEVLLKEVHIPFTGTFGGEPNQVYFFDENIIAKGYNEVKKVNHYYLIDAKDDL